MYSAASSVNLFTCCLTNVNPSLVVLSLPSVSGVVGAWLRVRDTTYPQGMFVALHTLLNLTIKLLTT